MRTRERSGSSSEACTHSVICFESVRCLECGEILSPKAIRNEEDLEVPLWANEPPPAQLRYRAGVGGAVGVLVIAWFMGAILAVLVVLYIIGS